MIEIQAVTNRPREGFTAALVGLTASLVLGFVLGLLQKAHFIAEAGGKLTIAQNDAIAANLLVVASLLIGVAIVQGQNLNRVKDAMRQVKSKAEGGVLEFLASRQAGESLREIVRQLQSGERAFDAAALGSAMTLLEDKMETARREAARQAKAVGDTYDELLAGFWILSFDVLIVIFLLFVVSFAGTELSTAQATIVSGLWWTSIIAIVASWWHLAKVALYTYRVE